jgi:TP901 family phage tail tape measure protein
MANEIQSFNVKFGANTVEFDNSLRGINKALKQLSTDIKTTQKELKFDPDNAEKLEKVISELGEQARVSEMKIKSLKEQQEQLGTEKIGTSEWNKLETQINKTESSLNTINKNLSSAKSHLAEVGDEKSVFNLNKALKETAQDLDTVNKKLELNPDDVNAAAEKTKLLAQQSTLAQEKVEALKKQQSELGDTKIGTAEWKSYDRQIVDAQLDVKKLSEDTKEVGSGEGESLGKKLDVSNLLQASQGLQQMGQGIKTFATDSMEDSEDVQKAFDAITKKTGETGDAYKGMIQDISGKVPVENISDIGEAIGEVRTQFGFTDKTLQSSSTAFLEYAKINDTDVTTSVQGAKKALDLFGLTAKDVPTYLNSMTKESQASGVSVKTLDGQLQQSAPILKSMGLSMQDSISFLGQLDKSGLNSSRVIMSLSQASSVYAKSGKSLSQGLKDTTEQIKNAKNPQTALNDAVKVFGTRNAPMMLQAIKQGKLNFSDFGKAGKDAGDAVSKTFEKTEKPIDKMKESSQQVKVAMGEAGDEMMKAFAPVAEKVAKDIGKIITWFEKLPKGVKSAILIIGGLVTVLLTLAPAIAAVVDIAPAMAKGISMIFDAIEANPIGALIALIAALVVAIVHWFTSTKEGQKTWKEIMKAISTAFSTVVKAISTGVKNIVSFFKNLWKTIQTIGKDISSWVKSVIKYFQNLEKSVTSAVSNLWKSVVKFFSNGIKSIINAVKNIATTIAGFFKGIPGKVESAVSGLAGLGKKIANWTISGLSGIGSRIVSFFKGIPGDILKAISGIKSIGSDIINWILDGLAGIGSKIYSKLKKGFDSAKKGFERAAGINKGFGLNSKHTLQYAGTPLGFSYLPNKLKGSFTGGSSNFDYSQTQNYGAPGTISISVESPNANPIDVAKSIEKILVRKMWRR